MTLTLLRNFRLLDPAIDDDLVEGYELLVEGDKVKELSDKPIKASKANVVNCGKRTLMPGLIDCHVHVIATMVNIGHNRCSHPAHGRHRRTAVLCLLLLLSSTAEARESAESAAQAQRYLGHPSPAPT